MSYEIKLNGLEFYAYHGVFDHEKQAGNTFLLDISLRFPLSKFPLNDKLEDAPDYQCLHRVAAEEMAIPQKLLETLAFNMTRRLWVIFPDALEVKITVCKKNPPLGAICDSSSVTLQTNQPF